MREWRAASHDASGRICTPMWIELLLRFLPRSRYCTVAVRKPLGSMSQVEARVFYGRPGTADTEASR